MNRRATLGLAAMAGLSTACTKTSLDDSTHPTGSRTVVTNESRSALYVANVFDDSVSRVDLTTGARDKVTVGAEPTRITRVQGRLFVTLRAERKLAVLAESSSGLLVEQTITVGAEPYAVVAPESGDKLYVSVSQGGEVVQIDPQTLAIERRWAIDGEPRWMAVHPSGDKVYVASAMQPLLTTIDVDTGETVSTRIPNLDFGGSNRPARITGDPAVSPDGRYVAVPTLHLDHEQPIDDESLPPPGGYYGGRFGPTVVTMPVEGGEPDLLQATVNGLPQGGQLPGYPSSVTWSPNSEELWVSVEGAAGVMTLDMRNRDNDVSVFEAIFVGTDDGVVDGASRSLTFRPTVETRAPAGTRGVVFTDDDKAYAHGFIDRKVRELGVTEVRDSMLDAEGIAFRVPELATPSEARSFDTTTGRLSPELEEGLHLFYSTTDPRVSSGGSGLSCATCHLEGRDDGLSWTFLRGKRQTPSLAGQVSLTEPVRWQGDRVTVEEDAAMTSRDAMGGQGMNEGELANLATFIDFVRDVDIDRGDMQDPAILRGQSVFENAGCADCHSGPRLTDNQSYFMYGVTVQTRSLVGLAATAPYLHDGRAATLESLVDSHTAEMGNTASLSAEARADLVRYLKTL